MGIVECFCGNRCVGKVAVPSAAHCPIKCPKLCYSAHGSATERRDGWTTDIAGSMSVIVPDQCVELFMFWHSIKHMRYMVSPSHITIECDQSMQIKLSDDCIQVGDQRVEPFLPFKLVMHDQFGFYISSHGRLCYLKQFIALSLAVNGAHLLY